MPPPLHTATLPTLLRYLPTLLRVLQAVERDCAGRIPEVLACRLAPDMMPLAAQVETAAYLALRTALPLAGRAVPPFSACDGTLAGLCGVVQRAEAQIRALPPEAFAGAEDRTYTEVAGQASLQLPGWAFVAEFALPNFIFHVSMAYAIARSQGCRLGKAQFDGYHAYGAPSGGAAGDGMASPTTLITARTAGVLYLAIIALGLFGEVFVRGSLVVGGDVAATARNIVAAQSLWRLGIATEVVMQVLDVPLIVFFYLLLKPVSHPLALLATAFNLVQTCVLAANKLNLVAALAWLTASARTAGQLDAPALAYRAIDLHSQGFGIGLIFFGLACLARSALMLKSGWVPRILGVLLGLAGIGYLVNSFALLLSPPLAAWLFPAVLAPALVGELALSLWLIFVGQASLDRRMASVQAARPRPSPG